MRAISQTELDAVRRSVASIAETRITAEKLVGRGIVGTTLKGLFPTPRLTEHLREIVGTRAERLGSGSAEQFTETVRASVGTADWARPRTGILEGLARTEVTSVKLAGQYGGAGGVRPREGITTALGFAGWARGLTAAEAMATDAKRVEALVAQARQPAMQQQLERMEAFEAAAARRYVRTPLVAKGFFPSDRLASLFEQSSALATMKLAETSIAPLARQIAALGTATVPDVLREISERERPMDTIVERFTKRWESSALWFLLSIISVGVLAAFDNMEGEEVEAVLLDALEVVITKGSFTAALDAAVREAAYISSDQRDDLVHGLEHAQLGEFVHAVPPLMTGLEGALWSTARALTIVDAERRQLSGKSQARSVVRIEPVVRRLPAKQDYRTFLTSRVFGNLGNPVRHGEQSDRRRQALFAIVAVAGWLDAFTSASAHEALGLMLSEALSTRRA